MIQTLRRFGGRQPLCGIGVTSLIPTTSMPVFWMVRIAVSRPEPGPLTTQSTLRTPCSIAHRARAGVLLAGLLAAGDGLLRALAGTCVRTGALPVHREAAAVT